MQKLLIRLIGLYVNFLALVSPKKAADLAITIFSTPRKGRPTEQQTKFLTTAAKRLVQYEELQIMTYHWSGAKDTVLLAHGWESNSGRWEDLVHRLIDEGYTVVAMDAPAHGESGGKRFNAILYAACMREVVKTYNPSAIIGHSVGGMASVFMVHKHGANGINDLILLGAPAHFEGVLERYVKLLGYSRRTANALGNLILERYGHRPEYFSSAEFMTDFSLKVMIIHDENDPVIPFEDAQLYKKNYPKSEFLTTTGLGHGLKDHLVYNELISFMKKRIMA